MRTAFLLSFTWLVGCEKPIQETTKPTEQQAISKPTFSPPATSRQNVGPMTGHTVSSPQGIRVGVGNYDVDGMFYSVTNIDGPDRGKVWFVKSDTLLEWQRPKAESQSLPIKTEQEKKKPRFGLNEYKSIENGMTTRQIDQILGIEGVELSRVVGKGRSVQSAGRIDNYPGNVTTQVKWSADKAGKCWIRAVFVNGRMTSVEQDGLK